MGASHRRRRACVVACLGALFGTSVGACGGSTAVGLLDGSADAPSGTPATPSGPSPSSDAGGAGSAVEGGPARPVDDAATSPPPATLDASLPPDPTDGTPTPMACTSARGQAISATYGRLDGYVAATRCGRVDTHLHLQVRANDAMYDVAVNLDTLYAELDAPMPQGAWSEGWHASAIRVDYPQTFGIHASAFTQPPSMGELATRVEQELANANHVSIFSTGYDSNDGAHNVHRRGRGATDGLIVIHPLSAEAHMILFRFADDAF